MPGPERPVVALGPRICGKPGVGPGGGRPVRQARCISRAQRCKAIWPRPKMRPQRHCFRDKRRCAVCSTGAYFPRSRLSSTPERRMFPLRFRTIPRRPGGGSNGGGGPAIPSVSCRRPAGIRDGHPGWKTVEAVLPLSSSTPNTVPFPYSPFLRPSHPLPLPPPCRRDGPMKSPGEPAGRRSRRGMRLTG